MPRTVYVTLSQKMAAEALVERSAVTGRPVSATIVKIANARRVNGDHTGGQDANPVYAVDAD